MPSRPLLLRPRRPRPRRHALVARSALRSLRQLAHRFGSEKSSVVHRLLRVRRLPRKLVRLVTRVMGVTPVRRLTRLKLHMPLLPRQPAPFRLLLNANAQRRRSAPQSERPRAKKLRLDRQCRHVKRQSQRRARPLRFRRLRQLPPQSAARSLSLRRLHPFRATRPVPLRRPPACLLARSNRDIPRARPMRLIIVISTVGPGVPLTAKAVISRLADRAARRLPSAADRLCRSSSVSA